MIYVIVQTIQLLGRRILLKIGLLSGTLIFAGLFQIIPMVFILPLMRVVGRPKRQAEGLPTRMKRMLPEDLANSMDQFIITTDTRVLIFSVGLTALLLFGFQAAITKYTKKYTTNFINGQSRILANRLFSNYLEADIFSYVNPIGRIESGCHALTSMLEKAILTGFSTAMFLMLAFVLIFIYPLQGISSIVVIVIAASLTAFYIQPKMNLIIQRAQMEEGRDMRALSDSMNAIKEIKLMGRERFFFNRYLKLQILRQTQLEMQEKLQAISKFLNLIMRYIGIGTGILLAVYLLPKEELAGFVLIFMMLAMKANAYAMQIINESKAMYQGFLVLKLHYKTLLKYDKGSTTFGDVPIICRESIEFRDIYFRYENISDEEEDYESLAMVQEEEEKEEEEEEEEILPFVLEGVNFKVQQGQFVGLVGRNGSGKSTIFDLFTGISIPTRGSILIDGQKLGRADRKAWRKQINYVIQKPHIISETIFYNVTLGLTEEEVDQQLLENALKLSMLDQVIEQLPHGLETLVGTRGTKISGGQAQRIVLARALYQDRPVLFLDEATRAIDAATESEIMEKISTMRGEKTVIIVTHRVQSLRQCDKIFVVDNKKIVAEGNYDDLCETSELFRLFALGKREKLKKKREEKVPSVA